MTITGHQQDPIWSGNAGLESGENGTVTYTVESDSPLDGWRTVVAYCETNIAARGAPYAIGNDSDPDSFVQDIAAAREPLSNPDGRIFWRVTYTYGPTSETEQRPDPTGQPTKDPVNWQPEYSVYFSPHSEEVNRAEFQGAFSNADPNSRAPCPVADNGPAITPGTVYQITNSAKDAVDPPVLHEEWDFVFRVTNWKSAWSTNWKGFNGTINSADFVIVDAVAGVNELFPATTARLLLGATFQRINNLWRWEVTWEFVVREKGWSTILEDVGLHAWAGVGAPKPGGGIWSGADLDPQRPCTRRVITQTDPVTGEEIPVSEPARLNGGGQPVDNDDGCDAQWFMDWLVPKQQNFQTLPIAGIGAPP